MVLGMEVGLSSGDFVLDGDPAPPQKGGRDLPQFSAHSYCGQTAECIKMPLGMDVGLSPFKRVVTLSTYSCYTNNCIYLSIYLAQGTLC